MWALDGLARHYTDLPNVVAYPAMLAGLHGDVIVPGAIFAAMIGLWQRPERRFVPAVIAGSLAIYLPYFWQESRFMFPAAALIAVYAGAFCADVANRFQVTEAISVPSRALEQASPSCARDPSRLR